MCITTVLLLSPFDKVIGMTYGMKGKNPIDQMKFYRKQTPNEAEELRKEDVSHFKTPLK